MAGTLTELSVAGRLALRAIGRRMRSEVEPAPDLDQFQSDMEQLLGSVPEGIIRDHCWLTLPSRRPPWLSSQLHIEAGDEVSYFAEGRAYANEFLDIYVKPAVNLWCKVGEEGEIFRGTRAGHSFVAKTSGDVQFGNYFPNDWVDNQGTRKQGDDIYKEMSGELRILVIRWARTAEIGLQELKASGAMQGRINLELERIAQGDTTPQGWHYLWHLGPGEIYKARAGKRAEACIHCHTNADVGILQKEVDLPLEESTEISWRWCIDRLPSTIREDAVPSHDYLSLAVEFDNGRDITYYWSSTLSVGTGYDCPLPNWKGIEYHVVVRSGNKGLGQWQEERRNLYQDYCQYMGEPPARITRIWLIANSIFQRGEGSCDYAAIELHAPGGSVSVL